MVYVSMLGLLGFAWGANQLIYYAGTLGDCRCGDLCTGEAAAAAVDANPAVVLTHLPPQGGYSYTCSRV